MKISVGQIYIRPGISFPFSHLFQKWLSEKLTAMVRPSANFVRLYGEEFTLLFNISAKDDIREIEVKGPTLFKVAKTVEYTVFLPYNVVSKSGESIANALRKLFIGIVSILESLQIDADEVSKHTESMVKEACSDPSMVKSTRK